MVSCQVRINITLDDETLKKLKELADKERRSVSGMVRELIHKAETSSSVQPMTTQV